MSLRSCITDIHNTITPSNAIWAPTRWLLCNLTTVSFHRIDSCRPLPNYRLKLPLHDTQIKVSSALFVCHRWGRDRWSDCFGLSSSLPTHFEPIFQFHCQLSDDDPPLSVPGWRHRAITRSLNSPCIRQAAPRCVYRRNCRLIELRTSWKKMAVIIWEKNDINCCLSRVLMGKDDKMIRIFLAFVLLAVLSICHGRPLNRFLNRPLLCGHIAD